MNYVYRFIDDVGKILYIGQTNSINNRMSSHFGKNGHLPQICLDNVARIDFKEIDEDVDINYIEKQLIQYFQPEFNQIHKGHRLYFIPNQHLEDWKVWKNIRPVIDPATAPNLDRKVIAYKWSAIDNMFMFVLFLLSIMIMYGLWNILNDFIKLI